MTAHTLINYLKYQLKLMQIILLLVFILYYHVLKWLCLGWLVATNLRNTFKFSWCSWSMILSKTFFMWVLIACETSHLPEMSIILIMETNKGSNKHPVCRKESNRKGSNKKWKHRHVHSPWKFIPLNLAISGDGQN